MSNLQRRLKKLEALMTDDARLVPGSQKWLAYWTEQFDKVVEGGDEAKHIRLPLAIFDVIVAAAESEGAPEKKRSLELQHLLSVRAG